MPHIRRDRPGGGPGGLEWTHPGHVVEVDDPDVSTQLVGIPGGGFTEVAPNDTGGFTEAPDPGFVVDPPAPKRRPGRPRKNVTPFTPITEAAVPHGQIGSAVGHDVSGAPHSAIPVTHVKGDKRGATWSANQDTEGREPGMVAPNAEALEASGARAAVWHARGVTPDE